MHKSVYMQIGVLRNISQGKQKCVRECKKQKFLSQLEMFSHVCLLIYQHVDRHMK